MAAKKPSRPVKAGEKGANRQANGQFGPGNSCGGAPYSKQKREERELIDSMLAKAVPAERLARIADKLATLAEEGNVEAAKFIFDRRLGKVTQPVEHTGEGGGPVKVVTEIEIVSGSND